MKKHLRGTTAHKVRKMEMNLRRLAQRAEKPSKPLEFKGRWIPAGEHKNVGKLKKRDGVWDAGKMFGE